MTDPRAEYAWVPPDVFTVKRREVLHGFLSRDRIYTSDAMHLRFEAQARRTLTRAISPL